MRLLFLSVIGFFLVACGSEDKVDFAKLEVRDGKYYKIGSDEPYSGASLETIRGHGAGIVPSKNASLLDFANDVPAILEPPAFGLPFFETSKILRNFEMGVLDGLYAEFYTYQRHKKTAKIIGNYTHGKKNGEFVLFERDKTSDEKVSIGKDTFNVGQVIESLNFKNGQAEGRFWRARVVLNLFDGPHVEMVWRERLYSGSTATFHKGVLNGGFEIHGLHLDKNRIDRWGLLERGEFKNGQLDGMHEYGCAPMSMRDDRELIKVETIYENGIEIGPREEFDCDPLKEKPAATPISESQEQLLRKLAEDLYDKCQIYGKSYDSRC